MITKAYPYLKILVTAELAVSLADVKTHLKITGSASDAYITTLIKSATLLAEKYTKKEFVIKTFKTFRDDFYPYPSTRIKLKRSEVQSIESIKYLKDGSLETVSAATYSFTEEVAKWSEIYLIDSYSTWPTDVDIRPQAIQIEFKAGYGTTSVDVPDDIQHALKMIIACLYENRGDCIDCATIDGQCFDGKVKGLLGQYRIEEISI